MHPPDPHQREKQLARYRESRRLWVALIGSVPFSVSSFVGMVANCSTGVWSEPPSPDSLAEVLVALGAVTRVATAAGLLLLLVSMMRLARRWWYAYWQRIERRRRRQRR